MSRREPFRQVRLGTILALLVLGTIVPLGLFAAQLVVTAWQQQQDLVNSQNVERARAISVAVDQEVQRAITALDTLAALALVEPENLQHFYDSAMRMLSLQPGWEAVRLAEPGSRVVVNTSVAFGEPSALVNNDWIRLVRDMKRPAVSAVARDPVTGQFFVSVGVPVPRAGPLRYVLGARIPASEFSRVLRLQEAPPDGVIALMDTELTIIARTRGEEVYLGAKPSPDFAAAVRSAPEGALRSMLLEGTPSFSAHSRSALTGWTIGIGFPAAAVDGPIFASLWLLVAVGVTILGGGLLMAFLVRWRIVRAQVAAVSAARSLARGEPAPGWTSRVTEFNDLAEGLRDAGAILERRLTERDTAERERASAVSELENALVREHTARVTGERNEARLLVTLRSIGDAVIATDAEGRVTVINAVAQALTGWSEPDAIGTPIDTVFVTRDERTRQPNPTPLARIASAGGAALPSRAVLISRDGREIPIGDSASPIQTADATLLGLVVVFRDTSAERDAEHQRRAAFEREQAARRTAEALSREKDEFVATVSHELRTPLNAIFGWVAMLKMGALDASGQAKALDVIDRNTRVQAQLIDDLLDMARVIRGTVRLEMLPVDFAAVVEAAVDAVKPAADARRVALRVHAQRGTALIAGDAGRLQQVVWNLLSNSIKFSNAGDDVDISLGQAGADTVLRVQDRGAGIDPAFLPHVFERFRQETSDVTREHAGLGLGLSLVRHLVELHGGSVTAESSGKNHGATFTVRLPLISAPMREQLSTDAADPAQAAAALGPILRNLNVLAVDDDADARDLVAAVLSQAGAKVTGASSVTEAIAAIESRPPDVVIADIATPQATGFELVGKLRATSAWCEIPVIALTAYGRGEDRAQALSLGFTRHLGKPFSPRALVALVAEVGRK